MKYNRARQIIEESKASAIARRNQQKTQSAARLIVEETERLELVQHLRIIEQQLKRLTGEIDEGWGEN